MTKTTVPELKSLWSAGFVNLFNATLNTVVTGVAVAAECGVIAADAAIKVVGEQSTKLGVVCAEYCGRPGGADQDDPAIVLEPVVETPVVSGPEDYMAGYATAEDYLNRPALG
jgi:hypothetical protein